ncbi:PREDICTED: enoyl-CoA delta isomerase 2, mitochondrial-like [Priapulus caudatus]|uniref:Enoyl-CoA delta isomerase 2, mitochondrial-like n=1 Tax=Priapulus caudatus TaxID=37621 RepID=A0ABM1F4K8_PRICU|nr:PREDICTED: enoyl-CoA delta isomerase 2, mitochondrial-like [Priapulus caudatus]
MQTTKRIFRVLPRLTAKSTLFGAASAHSRSFYTNRILYSLLDDFNKAKQQVGSLAEDPGNDVKLQMYALFKQSMIGSCNAPKPGMMDFVGKAKWTAWSSLGDLSQDDAKKQYIDVVNGLLANEASAQPVSPQAAAPPGGYHTLVVSNEGGVFTIRINRPDKKNALTMQTYEELIKALDQASNDKTVVLAAVTGTGDYYSSGNDLSNFANIQPDQIAKMADDARDILIRFVGAFIDFPKPLISLVNGPAVGVMVTTLGLYDAVYATDKATFHTPFSQLGQTPEGCSSYTFPKLMGTGKAAEMLLFNQKISAHEACQRDLVTEVFPDSSFHKEVTARLQRHAKYPVKSMVYAKKLYRDQEREILHKINAQECDRLVERWQSEDCINAIMSFFSKKSKM